MIKALSIGKLVIISIGNKMYQKEFDTTEKKNEVYELLLNTDENNESELKEIVKLFQAEKTSVEVQLELEFEQKKAESKKFEDILDLMKDIKANGHDVFEVVENSLYVKGIKISVPELLVRDIIKSREGIKKYDNPKKTTIVCTYLDRENARLKALLNFWSLCALNPDPRARFDLFKFLSNHNLNLTSSGNFVAYRTVNKYKTGDEELEKFVTQEWMKVKRWKKSPKNYDIYVEEKETPGLDLIEDFNDDFETWNEVVINDVPVRTGKYCLGTTDATPKLQADFKSWSRLGNLDELYHNIGETSGNVYTDAHTGTYRIKIGEPVTEDRGIIDPDPNQSCSKGLHIGNQAFMRANMGYFGKVGIICLVNPKDVTSVPEHDSGKMRTCKYLPIAIAELGEDGHIVDVDIDVFDLELAQNTQEELEAMSKLSSTELEEYKKHEFIAPEIDYKTVTNILKKVTISIDEANNKIKDRVVKV